MLVVCLVGAGPRGLSVLERLCAGERTSPAHAAVTVHVVDPYPPGPGKVWRTGQSRRLLMNTVASQVTVFTDHTVTMDGPVEEGPSLHAWATGLAPWPADPRVSDRFPPEVRAEAARLGPDDYPTRALYGAYLREAFRRVRGSAPAHVTVVEHRTSAVALHDGAGPGGPQSLLLADGTLLTGLDAVVLAQGHLPALPTAGERTLAEAAAGHGLSYFAPANPADLDLSTLAPGETVFVRGLGLNFFDVVALLTEDRGGVFVRDGGRLRYRPSGREPRIVAGSRRGVPYHARGENHKGPYGRYEPRLLTPRTVARLHRRAENGERLSFLGDLWPLIAKEVESVYYGTFLSARGRSAEREAFVEEFLAAADEAAQSRVLDAYGVAADDRWNWERLARPWAGRELRDRAAYRAWLLRHLAQDVREARAGNVDGPLKAALDVLRDLRNEIRTAVDHGRLEGGSYQDDLQGWYTPLNAFLSIGPPVSRTEQLIALVEAGVVEILGPDIRVHAPGTAPAGEPQAAFRVVSGVVPGAPVMATALIEARLPDPDLTRTADPLLRGLVESGQAARFRIDGSCGTSYATRGLAVTERPYRLVDAAGRVHPRRFALGVPTEGVHWVTAAGIRPGVDSMTLGDSDAIARAVLAPAAATTPLPDLTSPTRAEALEATA
ncbi:FAD/NAD(P)-binding protein [Streptomyces sp. CAI-121]|uniref:FAD/NAD(P)-binding protein n=1 Tax=unclassified Streptomyces TaxID=2593676 RepID=UPI001587181A|nr:MULTISPECIES: FAD/NAD(P)-binding protein [unclassified Streptomyces]NUV66408.1 FAD/NAD(P)-binding protein [Streptomyces sp. CAI-121]NUW11910.1 FAD/NAD(P)-binding protein [Streptomyces sp. CAI-68]